MSNKELERKIYNLEEWVCKLYEAIKIIQEKTGIELTKINELLGIPPYDPSLSDNIFEKKIYKDIKK